MRSCAAGSDRRGSPAAVQQARAGALGADANPRAKSPEGRGTSAQKVLATVGIHGENPANTFSSSGALLGAAGSRRQLALSTYATLAGPAIERRL